MSSLEQLAATRAVLDKIDDLLMSVKLSTRCDVMSVLTALRGPDSPVLEDRFKATSTCVIREAALPKVFALGEANINLDTNRGQFKTVEVIPKFYRTFEQKHFFNHIVWAAEVLGLPLVEVKP